jgi:cytochrome c-type biogenesis protein CcmH
MNVFWILVVALVIAAVAGLLVALLRPRAAVTERNGNRILHETRLAELRADVADQVIAEQELAAAEDEIARALLHETSAVAVREDHTGTTARWLTAGIIFFFVPAVAVLTYLKLGDPGLATGAGSAHPTATASDQGTVDEMLTTLEQRLLDDPDSAEGWLLLGRSYMALNRYAEAVPALARALDLVGDVPRVLLLYADALAMVDGGRISNDVRALVERALKVEPGNVAALWLAGLGAAETGNQKEALDYLRRARTLTARDGGPTAELDAVIRGLETDSAAAPEAVAAVTVSVDVRVDVDPSLSSRIESDDVLFVFARAPGQGGPPLAVMRSSAASLPLDVVLDDTMAMAPMFKLTDGETVAVTARISKSASPGAAPGDLQGTSEPFVVGNAEVVNIMIDEVVE